MGVVSVNRCKGTRLFMACQQLLICYSGGMKLEEAIEAFGSSGALCRVLGVRPQHLYNWRKRGIPKARQYEIEALSGGRVKADRSHLPARGAP